MLEDAEKVLRDAAAAGNASATAYLASSWSNEKREALLAIAKGHL